MTRGPLRSQSISKGRGHCRGQGRQAGGGGGMTELRHQVQVSLGALPMPMQRDWEAKWQKFV